MPDDFEKTIATLRALIDRSADDLYRRVVRENREWIVRLCLLRSKLKGTNDG